MSAGTNTDLIKFQYDRDLRCLIISNIIPLNTHAEKKLLKLNVALLKTKCFEHDQQNNIYSSEFKRTAKALLLLLIILINKQINK